MNLLDRLEVWLEGYTTRLGAKNSAADDLYQSLVAFIMIERQREKDLALESRGKRREFWKEYDREKKPDKKPRKKFIMSKAQKK